MKQFPEKIAILGIGLIGGSIALGLKKHFGTKITIFGSCRSLKRAQIARKMGIIDVAFDARDQLPADIRLVIIATPIQAISEILKLLANNLPEKTLIIDVGSTKKFIADKAKKFPAFIGTHPVTGTEMSGFENASFDLFCNKPWIVCRNQISISKAHLATVKELITILGAKMLLMEPETHDRVIAWASHLSLVNASILVNLCAKQKAWKKISGMASTGFKDTTRLASDNPEMKTDIVLTNTANILSCLEKLKTEINTLAQLISENNKPAILKYFQGSKKIRDNWLNRL